MSLGRTHTSREYEAELQGVRENLLRMAGMVEQMIAEASEAVTRGDTGLARQIIESDELVNKIELDTDDACLLILAKRQPLASDLRMITLAMKMVTDLERIGDLAVNIGERVLALASPPKPEISRKLARMADVVQSMIRVAIDSFVSGNATRARGVFEVDEEVDELYREVSTDMQGSMTDDGEYVDRGIHIQAIAKFLERIGDHGTNLAELVIYMIEGKDLRHSSDRWQRQE